MISASSIEMLLALFVLGAFAAGGVALVADWLIMNRLRKAHPKAWDELGRPTLPLGLSVAGALNFRRFIGRGEHRALSDGRIEVLVRRKRIAEATYLIMLLGFGALLVLHQ